MIFESKLYNAIRRDRIEVIETKMDLYPIPGVLYYCPIPAKLDRLKESYYHRALIHNIQYGVNQKNEMRPVYIWERKWNVMKFECRGGKKCQNKGCDMAATWISTSSSGKCKCCRHTSVKYHACKSAFYYLEEDEAEEPGQMLFSWVKHSHGYLAPNRIPDWIMNEVERIALFTALHPRDIHAGRGSTLSDGGKANLLSLCPPLANLERLGSIMRRARRRTKDKHSAGEFGPGDVYRAIRSIQEQSKSTLNEGM